MISISKKNAVAAKAKALFGKCLTDEDYKKLLSFESIEETAEYLRTHTAYSAVLTTTTVNNEITPEVVEQRVTAKNEQDITKICKYSSLIADNAYLLTIVTSDTRVLLCSARLIISPTTRDNIYIPDDFCKKHSKLHHEAIYKSTTAEEFLQSIKGTVYYKMLKPCIDTTHNNFDMPQLESVLYNYRRASILSHCANRHARKEIIEILKLDTDKFNISTIYRLKKYSNKSDEVIKALISSDGGSLTTAKLHRLIEAENEHDFLNELSDTKFQKVINEENLDYIEGAIDRLILSTQKKYLRQSVYPDVQIFSYIQFVRNESRNICKIIEAKRYGLENSEIEKFIIS